MIDAIVILIVLIAAIFFVFGLTKKKKPVLLMPEEHKNLLAQHVPFYNLLDDDRKKIFENRMQYFLSVVRITGVKTVVEDLDKVLIAASAIIPIFAFDNWEYPNLNEVLLYPDSFDFNFRQEGMSRNISGMVGTGGLNNMMVLSQNEIRRAFMNNHDFSNAAIHEFVHLIDKTDGSISGVPSVLMNDEDIQTWTRLMQQEIQRIHDDESEINPYAATDQGEFFAVISEYFFKQPEWLKENRREIFEIMAKTFRVKSII